MILSFPRSNKIYITSDVHGGKSLLEKHVSRVSEDSYLFIIGDLIEKGEDSLATLRYIMNLSKKDNVFVTIGNNDYAFLKALEKDNLDFFKKRMEYKHSIIYQLKKELNEENPEKLQELIKINLKDEIEFLCSLKSYYIIEDFLLVHAGVSKEGLEKSTLSDLIRLNNFYNIGHNEKYIVVCGHYPTSMYRLDAYDNNVLIDLDKRIICIDGGYAATNMGQLNMLEITKNGSIYEYKTFYEDAFPKYVIKRSEEGFGNSRGICFPNFEIEILKKDVYFSTVRVVSTNEVMFIKNELITEVNGKYYSLDDCPNNFLTVKVGEVVSVVMDHFDGYTLIKKNGICGWIKKI